MEKAQKQEQREQERREQAQFAQQVLRAEAQAIERIAIGPAFHEAVELIHRCAGSVVVSGVGKSGLIGQKISATFASTGTPSHFLHPTEAMHGDLGRVRRGDVVVLLSFGGNTDEVVTLAELLRQDEIALVGIVGKSDCDLARLATVALPIGDVTEACPLNLAPTASTTAMLALGDAMALVVSRKRNFGVEEFRKVHPGGALGRQLMPVVSVIRFKAGGNLPLIKDSASVQEAYAQAEKYAQESGLRRAGALLIVDAEGLLAGIVTDGDLRTALIRKGPGAWAGRISEVMTRRPTTLGEEALVRDAVRIVREHRFDEIPIVDGAGRPVGLIDVQDLAALKVIEG
jgi:arabinose-5-phosphate isomerase